MEEKKRYLMGMGEETGDEKKGTGKKNLIVSGTRGYDVGKFTK